MADPKEVTKAASKVDSETAALEVEKFLDLKRVPDSKRKKDFDVNIEMLEGMVEDGRLRFDFEKKRAIYTLLSPLERKESGTLKELSMRFYIGMQAASNVLKKVDAGDIYGRSLAMAGDLAGVSPDILRNAKNDLGENGLDISDVNSILHYITFFLA